MSSLKKIEIVQDEDDDFVFISLEDGLKTELDALKVSLKIPTK